MSPNLKREFIYKKGKRVVIRGLQIELEKSIKIISKNLNIPYSDLLKLKIHEKINKFPDYLKKEPNPEAD